jgi:hypothetical protein
MIKKTSNSNLDMKRVERVAMSASWNIIVAMLGCRMCIVHASKLGFLFSLVP